MTVSQDISCRKSSRFYIPNGEFSFHRQYSKIYAARLSAAKPYLIASVCSSWNAVVAANVDCSKVPIRSLNNLVTDERCVIIGTVYKEMKKKPSVLRELASSEAMRSLLHEEGDENLHETPPKLFSPDDAIFLEDEVQRIQLNFSQRTGKTLHVSSNKLITGVVLALLGFEPESEPGSFTVEDVMFLEPQPEHPICAKACSTATNPKDCMQFRTSGPWLALVSGLEFTGTGSTKTGHAMALQLLADWIRCSGDWSHEDAADPQGAMGVVRLMILGDSIYTPGSRASHGILSQQARYLTRNTEAESVTAMTHFDSWLANLPLGPGPSASPSNGFPVDLLPGPSDPTSPFLPQQPVHAVTLPISLSRFGGSDDGGLCGRTNPFLTDVYGRTVLATAGQGVNDLLHYTDIEDACDRMEATLLWGHLAPSCPDTLASYPLLGTDLLLLRQNENASNHSSPDYPDIYVAGCQPGSEPHWRRASLRWNNRDSDGALLVSVPRFSTSRALVLVHLETLDCRVVYFDTSALDAED